MEINGCILKFFYGGMPLRWSWKVIVDIAAINMSRLPALDMSGLRRDGVSFVNHVGVRQQRQGERNCPAFATLGSCAPRGQVPRGTKQNNHGVATEWLFRMHLGLR